MTALLKQPVVRIPPIAGFAREIDTTLAAYEIDRCDFDAAVDVVAEHLPCPRTSKITYAGEYLNEYVLVACRTAEFTDDELNAWARTAIALCPEFRAEFAHYFLHQIVRELHAKRLKDAREWNRNLGEY